MRLHHDRICLQTALLLIPTVRPAADGPRNLPAT